MAHGSQTLKKSSAGLPSLEEMQKSLSSITKDQYDEILRSKPYLPKHHLKPNGGKDYQNT